MSADKKRRQTLDHVHMEICHKCYRKQEKRKLAFIGCDQWRRTKVFPPFPPPSVFWWRSAARNKQIQYLPRKIEARGNLVCASFNQKDESRLTWEIPVDCGESSCCYLFCFYEDVVFFWLSWEQGLVQHHFEWVWDLLPLRKPAFVSTIIQL